MPLEQEISEQRQGDDHSANRDPDPEEFTARLELLVQKGFSLAQISSDVGGTPEEQSMADMQTMNNEALKNVLPAFQALSELGVGFSSLAQLVNRLVHPTVTMEEIKKYLDDLDLDIKPGTIDQLLVYKSTWAQAWSELIRIGKKPNF